MSCVVGIMYDEKIYMGADGYATADDGERRPIVAEKLFFNKDYLIGYTGSVRTGQVLKPEKFDPPSDIEDLPDAIREHLFEKGCVLSSEEHGQIHTSNFLIGHQGMIYEILIDFQMNKTYGDFNSIGAGSQYAFGSLYTTRFLKNISPQQRIKLALNAASFYNVSCGPPFTYESIE